VILSDAIAAPGLCCMKPPFSPIGWLKSGLFVAFLKLLLMALTSFFALAPIYFNWK
jgi:hypothetical protein